ncbi:hypothetical protein TcWFU_004682 [Taenia crassiceps]|uniref:Uncharacterized protein n=1 Tax=Taenia crassiceps TaxID=6207 RepID=A0ABR4QKX0_9CEST
MRLTVDHGGSIGGRVTPPRSRPCLCLAQTNDLSTNSVSYLGGKQFIHLFVAIGNKRIQLTFFLRFGSSKCF